MSNTKKIVLAVGITFFATIIIISVPFYFLFVKDVEQLERQNELLRAKAAGEVEIDTFPKAELSTGPKLVKKTSSGTELALAFDNEYARLIAWNNWLFTGDQNYGTKDKKAQVWAYNTVTGVKKKLFDLGLVNEEIQGGRGENFQYVNNLQIFDNKLFISLGGYLMPGYIYTFELNGELSNPPVYLGTAKNPSVEYSNGVYLIYGGEGDAGCSWKEVSKLDIQEMKLVKLFETSGCTGERGQMVIGNDKDQLYVGDYQYIPSQKNEIEGYNEITTIKAISLSDPQKKVNIIKEGNLPEGIYLSSVVNSGKNSLFLVGKKLYKYDLTNGNKLVEVSLPEGESDRLFLASSDSNVLCFMGSYGEAGGYTKLYSFNILSNQFSEFPLSDFPVLEKDLPNDPCFSREKVYNATIAGTVAKLKDDGILSSEFEYLEK